MAELLLRYMQTWQEEQAETMGIELESTVKEITKLKELPSEIRLFQQPADQPDFHVKLEFLELEVPLRLFPEIRSACFRIMQKHAHINQHIRITIVREFGEMEERMGNLST